MTMGGRSRWAVLAAILGCVGVFDVLLGPALIHTGLASPMRGFGLFQLGLLSGLLALLTGVVALVRTRAGSGRGGRELAWLGLGCGLALLAVGLGGARPGSGAPLINDITTDPTDPPGFEAALRESANQGRNMDYPSGNGPLQTAAYADLAPIRVSSPPARALELAEETARKLGWEIVDVEPGEGRLEARQVSKVFMFVDDIVVRIRPRGAGAVVDVRSKSRDGRGDLGANAERIRAFVAEIPR